MKVLDTHSHILFSSYKEELQDVINALKEQEIVVFNIAYDLDSSKEVLDLFKRNNFLIPVIGIHPSDSVGYNKDFLNNLENMINDDAAAIGEIGLDYHFEGYNKEEQKIAFIEQIKLASKYDLPIVIHTRDSLEDCYEIISLYPKQKFLLHSWSGDSNMTKKYLSISNNIYFSYNGILTFKNAKLQQEIIKMVPIDRLLFETDCPYLSPIPFRGKQNFPWRTKKVIEFASEILEISYDNLLEINKKNALNFFKVDKELLN